MPWEVVPPKKLSFWICSMYGIFSVAFGVDVYVKLYKGKVFQTYSILIHWYR